MRFGATYALAGVTVSVRRGEVFGLLGQNGSGKSTLIKVLAGLHQPEPGSRVTLWGDEMTPPLDPMRIKRRGVAFVHQHLALVPSLTVLENMRVTALKTRSPWRMRWRREAAEIRRLFAEFDLDIDPFAPVSALPPVERAFVAIVRAFEDLRASEAGRHGEGILILDEPTPFLPAEDVERLFTLIRSIVKTGTSVVIVTHDIDEVLAITDRVAVLRDGKLVDVLDTASAGRQAILDTIVGTRIDSFERARHPLPAGPAVLRVDQFRLPGGAPFDLKIRAGETLGVTGLIGSGFAALPYALFGAASAAGRLTLDGRTVDLARLDPLRAQRLGIALLPGDRLGAAGIGPLSVADNITLPLLETYWQGGVLRRGRMAQDAARLALAHDVRPPRPELPLAALSGGNQQKVLLAKWLQTKPKLLLLDEPTQGVDFGARQQIFADLDRATRDGTAILCASTDNEQLAQICDRVLVFAQNRPVLELTGAELTKEAISEACFNSAGHAGAAKEPA
nr:sugar ABC transporter ATP-binding protein [Salipiger pentaromativorans]